MWCSNSCCCFILFCWQEYNQYAAPGVDPPPGIYQAAVFFCLLVSWCNMLPAEVSLQELCSKFSQSSAVQFLLLFGVVWLTGIESVCITQKMIHQPGIYQYQQELYNTFSFSSSAVLVVVSYWTIFTSWYAEVYRKCRTNYFS
jgi:hypothetical protein